MSSAVIGILAPLVIYGIITVLHLILPARIVKGYVMPRYRLNGPAVLLLSIALWFLLGFGGSFSLARLYELRYYSLAGAFAMGIIFSLIMVLSQQSAGGSFVVEFYFGRLENPQLGKGLIDAKMWLYLIGAVMLELNVLSISAWHWDHFGKAASPGILISAVLFSWFVVDYLIFEEVHLYTYDFFAEKVGFKLGWGCLVFYPFFYALPLFATAGLPDPHSSMLYRAVSVFIFLTGWVLSRGANLQKFFFKTTPEKSFLGIQPEAISEGDKKLLVSGFWGLSRHINYLGEILMASGIVLSLGYPGQILPWLYPLYYVALLFPRQRADDRRCSAKYGALWEEYERKVKYRIIPFIY